MCAVPVQGREDTRHRVPNKITPICVNNARAADKEAEVVIQCCALWNIFPFKT